MSTKRGTLGDRMTQPDPVDAVLNAALDDEGDLGPAPHPTPAPAPPKDKPQFAVMNIRMPPELHRALRLISLDRGESVNSMLVKAAEKIVARNRPV